MLETVPAPVETAIYTYFVVVAALGCYLHGRLWIAYRQNRERNRTTVNADETPQLEG